MDTIQALKEQKGASGGPEGGRAAFDGWHGSMKPEGRRKAQCRSDFN
jgi:hypothetical protein